ncbi:MAG: gamma-glutamyltransferase [Flammeovirgaceae bacterium]
MSKLKGVIAAGNAHTAEAGAEVLKAGGNAFDAAVAAAWMTFVAEPTMTSAGGGGFLTGFTSAGKPFAIDFFTQTPKVKKPEHELNFYPVEIDYGGSTQIFHAGLASAAVPGCVAGLFHIHKRLGKMPFHELVQPALAVAKKGMLVNDFIHSCFLLVGPAVTSLPSGKALFQPQGDYLKPGDYWTMPKFADTMEYLAKHGPDEFYKGEIAHKIVKDCAEKGGYLTTADFEEYQVVERHPIRIPYRNYEVCTNPPPSAGGSLVAFTLKMLEQEPLWKYAFGSPEHLNALTNAMKITYRSRAERFDSHIHHHKVTDYFFDKEYLAKQQSQMPSKKPFKLGSTTHFSVADAENNIASITTSLGEGSGYAAYGVMMNNMLGEEDLNPGGFHLWPTDHRITSMMSPTIVLKDGRPVLATGTGGANRIRSVIAQVISNYIDFKMHDMEAVNAPRIHWEAGKLDIEPGFEPYSISSIDTSEALDIVQWDRKSFYFGGAHSIVIDDYGELRPLGDERRTGAMQIV